MTVIDDTGPPADNHHARVETVLSLVMAVVHRTHRKLGCDLSAADLRRHTASLSSLHALVWRYAEHSLVETSRRAVFDYAARISATEVAASCWSWPPLALFHFALADYLADHPDRGDVPLRELVVKVGLTADLGRPDGNYRRYGDSLYDTLRRAYAGTGAIDALARRAVQPATTRHPHFVAPPPTALLRIDDPAP